MQRCLDCHYGNLPDLSVVEVAEVPSIVLVVALLIYTYVKVKRDRKIQLIDSTEASNNTSHDVLMQSIPYSSKDTPPFSNFSFKGLYYACGLFLFFVFMYLIY